MIKIEKSLPAPQAYARLTKRSRKPVIELKMGGESYIMEAPEALTLAHKIADAVEILPLLDKRTQAAALEEAEQEDA